MPPPSGYTPPSGANDAGADPAALDSGASSPNVSFTYDTAGNRATMTDALGTTAYNYDTWSHLTSETRTFTDLAGYGSNLGSYSIDYTYNLGGQLTSIRDPFRSAGANHTVSYAYDKLGQLTGINATGYKDGYWNNSSQWITPDVPVLASQITHRAWGATTHASYGNNLTLSATYNQQMQPVHFKVSSIYNNAPYLVIAGDYEYNSDGKVRFVAETFDNSTNPRYDRAYGYDDVGRLVEAYSGTQAQAFNAGQPQPSTVDRPYRQSYNYNVWGNLTTRNNLAWSQSLNPVSDTYLNDRNQSTLWQHDYAGNVTHDNDTQFLYDSAGRQTHMNQGTVANAVIIDEGFDGGGQFVKRREQHTDPNNHYDKTTYYVRSSVLGGQPIVEVNVTDGKNKINLYSPDGQLLAESDGSLLFVHKSPMTGTQTKVNLIAPGPSSAAVYQNGTEYDPLGADVGLSDPFVHGYINYVDFMANKTLYMNGGNLYDASGGYQLSGIAVPCNLVAQLLNSGAAELKWVPDRWMGRPDPRSPVQQDPPGTVKVGVGGPPPPAGASGVGIAMMGMAQAISEFMEAGAAGGSATGVAGAAEALVAGATAGLAVLAVLADLLIIGRLVYEILRDNAQFEYNMEMLAKSQRTVEEQTAIDYYTDLKNRPDPEPEQKPGPEIKDKPWPPVIAQKDDDDGLYLVRFGAGPETIESLTMDAEAAAKNPRYGFGVSTRLKDRISGSDWNNRWAPFSEVRAAFPVSQTGDNPLHYTVFLPNPITQDVVDLFNSIFTVRSRR